MIINGKKYSSHKFRADKASFDDCVDTSRSYIGKDLYKMVLMEYLKIVANTMLDGYSWVLPRSFGELSIVKRSITKKMIRDKINTMTPKLGFHYELSIKSDIFRNNGMSIYVDGGLKDRIHDIVNSKKRDYRYEH